MGTNPPPNTTFPLVPLVRTMIMSTCSRAAKSILVPLKVMFLVLNDVVPPDGHSLVTVTAALLVKLAHGMPQLVCNAIGTARSPKTHTLQPNTNTFVKNIIDEKNDPNIPKRTCVPRPPPTLPTVALQLVSSFGWIDKKLPWVVRG